MGRCPIDKLILAVSLVCAVLAVSCADERTCGPDRCHWPVCASTPMEVLNLTAKAFKARNIEAFARYLDETYVFEFAEEDWESVGVSSEEPFWARATDLEAMDSLLNAAVTSISFIWGMLVSAHTEGDSAKMVLSPDIQVTVDLGGSEPVTYWDNYFWLEITLKRSGDSCWTISKIKEMAPGKLGGAVAALPARLTATEPTSFGRMKWMALDGRFSR